METRLECILAFPKKEGTRFPGCGAHLKSGKTDELTDAPNWHIQEGCQSLTPLVH